MKRIIALCLCIVLGAACFAGCGAKKNPLGETLLYNYPDVTKYVTLSNYKGIKVDTSSGKFASYMEEIKNSELADAGLGGDRELTADDTVKNGDALVIDYSGKMNGVVFEGGTAEDQELTIGSGQMIPGFEAGIIGAKLGEKREVKVTFPDPYPNNSDFSGKPAVFDITVKSGTRTEYPEVTADIAKQLGYASAEKYEEHIKSEAVKNYLFDVISDKCEVKSYPEKEVDYYVDLTVEYYEKMCESYQITFDDYLAQSQLNREDFETQLREQLKPTIKSQLVCYGIAQKEKLALTQKDKDAFIKKTAAKNNTTADEVRKNSEESEIEFNALLDKVLFFLVNSAKIK